MLVLTASAPAVLGTGRLGATLAVLASAWILVLAFLVDGSLRTVRRVFFGSMAQLVVVLSGFWVGA